MNDNISEFSPKIIEELKYYDYVYSDPANRASGTVQQDFQNSVCLWKVYPWNSPRR